MMHHTHVGFHNGFLASFIFFFAVVLSESSTSNTTTLVTAPDTSVSLPAYSHPSSPPPLPLLLETSSIEEKTEGFDHVPTRLILKGEKVRGIFVRSSQFMKYNFVMISNDDKKSLIGSTAEVNGKVGLWTNRLINGYFEINLLAHDSGPSAFKIVSDVVISTGYNFNLRGSELSAIVKLSDGSLLVCDNRSGIIYQLFRKDDNDYVMIPHQILSYNSRSEKGFRCQWMVFRSPNLFVGSNGKNMKKTTESRIVDRSNEFIYVLNVRPNYAKCEENQFTINGKRLKNWRKIYSNFYTLIKVGRDKGFIIHEAVTYSEIHRKWFFAPSKIGSSKKYNVLLWMSQCQKQFGIINIDDNQFNGGYSDIKFVPNTNDSLIFATRTFEKADGGYKSYSTIFTVNGTVVMPNRLISQDRKIAGIEFL